MLYLFSESRNQNPESNLLSNLLTVFIFFEEDNVYFIFICGMRIKIVESTTNLRLRNENFIPKMD